MHMMSNKWVRWCGMLGNVLWTVAALCLVMAWVAVWRRGLVLGLEPLAWYWNALVLGVLAGGCKGHHGTCLPEEKAGM